MIVINFFGGAGSGKSAQAAGLFWLMKNKDYSVELINEFPKQLVWEKHYEALSDQLYILANQNRQVLRLEGQVNYCITDSPTLLSLVYKNAYSISPYSNALNQLALESFERNSTINFFLESGNNYKQTGRVQNEEQSYQIEEELKEILDKKNIKYYLINYKTENDILTNMLKYVEHESSTK